MTVKELAAWASQKHGRAANSTGPALSRAMKKHPEITRVGYGVYEWRERATKLSEPAA